ncbi:hypothetical protein BELL_0770g00030 [Botrytis elliptica]|uniref:Heterokaryon incompatibility domain-containing protein n=1 Tax=Botrytis elliptica TaxID=278938 RepID=A0A4Z1JDP2_9HELO|nr:hypothetical protein BELL_0770g00030 [Botrytis elliptica]
MASGIPFQYLPLEKTSDIRLLQISLSPDSKRLCGKFTHVSLDVIPPIRVPYAAISYHWGSADMCDQIRFDEGHYLGLNSSAGKILRSFAAHLDFEFEPCFLWIDALCINQNYNMEKGSQVRQIGRIYSSARQVLAWIGDESTDSDLAMDFVVILHDLMIYFGTPSFSDVISVPGCEHRSPGWKALDALLQRPWFSRTWIIQEVVLGTHVVRLCGQKAMNWSALGFVANVIIGLDLEKLLFFRRDGSFPDEKVSSVTLEYALFQGLDFKATNPRDKVYALFGISTDIEAMGIDVNYNATVKEVYTDATIRILNQGTSLSLLNSAGIGKYRNDEHISINHDLPSWVPDSNLLSIPASSEDYKMPEASKAKKSLININSTNPDRISMKIQGRSVSRVTAIYPSRPTTVYKNNVGEFQVELKQRRDWIIETMNYASRLEPYPSGIPWRQVYSRTLVNNKLPLPFRGMPVEPPYWEHLDVLLEVLENIIGANAQEVSEIEKAGGVIEGFDEEIVEKTRKFASGVAFRGRMFEMDNGYLGMGQEGMEVGDEVCLFYGGETPYIVRRLTECQSKATNQTSGHEYVLVGDCYVDGWMDGEAMGIGEEKEFVLV